MKKLSILLSALFIGGIFVFVSCTKTGDQGPSGQNGATGPQGPTGPTGPIIYGTISGNVIMVNQYGGAVTNAYTNGYIKLINTATNTTVDSVIATSTGSYAISNVPTGTYNMECIYSGYGENMHQNLEVNGNLQVDNKIAAIPNFNVTSAADSNGLVKRDTNYAYVSGNIAQDNNGERTVLVFVGTSTTTSSTPGNYLFTVAQTVAAGATTYSVAIPLANIYSYNIGYGASIYFAVYGAANNYDYGSWTNFNVNNGQVNYTAITSTSVSPVPTPLTLPLK